MSVGLKHWLFTVEDYHRMEETGILTEDDRVELLQGEIIQMIPVGSRHASCVSRLNHNLTLNFGFTAIISILYPIGIIPHSEPQPDIAVLRFRDDFYADTHPTPADILLVIESWIVRMTSIGMSKYRFLHRQEYKKFGWWIWNKV